MVNYRINLLQYIANSPEYFMFWCGLYLLIGYHHIWFLSRLGTGTRVMEEEIRNSRKRFMLSVKNVLVTATCWCFLYAQQKSFYCFLMLILPRVLQAQYLFLSTYDDQTWLEYGWAFAFRIFKWVPKHKVRNDESVSAKFARNDNPVSWRDMAVCCTIVVFHCVLVLLNFAYRTKRRKLRFGHFRRWWMHFLPP